ncbi:MAG: DUF3365 domain-containing protein [Steroidobacteraceae bacterium]|nr:DUF3365 domain-containing protein [Steroidobacteraceae bacterium]
MLSLSSATGISAPAQAPGAATNSDEAARAAVIAQSLTALLRASREVISTHQGLINDPAIGDKKLTGAKVLTEALVIYQFSTGIDPKSIDPTSWHGRLFRAQQLAIVEAVDANQSTLNQLGIGFKGFIPSTFGRLVNEASARHMSNEALVKVTAPEYLIRNRKARPDEWEAAIIRDKLLLPTWPKGKMFAAEAPSKGRAAFRFASPEYYTPSCLSCHGNPKGEIDITGHPKEGGSEGDLGAVISVTIFSRVH